MTKYIKQFGLKILPKDNRDFRLSKITTLPALNELPEEFVLKPLTSKNQFNSDYCTAFATCGASEIQEGVELSPEWSFAVSKMISGDPEEFGQDLRTACKVHTQFGAVEAKIAPYSLVRGDSDEKMRYISNWPENLFDEAIKHKKQSFVKIDGQYDHFDNLRAFLWLFRDKKQAGVLGVEFGWPLSQIIMQTCSFGGGHAIYEIGWAKKNNQTYLVIQNSYSGEAGEKNRHYFSREVINDCVNKYGAFCFVDMPPGEIKRASWSFWQKLWSAITNYFGEIFK